MTGPSAARGLGRVLSADAGAPRRYATLRRETILPAPLDETFAFFADAANLERLTPPWLHFTILTPMPVAMRAGLDIAYRIRLYGLSLPWVSRIDVWEPGHRFIDRQLVGPYRWWHHEHRFERVGSGTRIVDTVQWAPRLPWMTRRFVGRQLERIFSYRQQAMEQIFSSPERRPLPG